MATHRGDLDEAEEKLDQAEKNLREIKKLASSHPDLAYSGSLRTAYQEYAEAHILLMFVREGKFLNPKDLDIPSIPYLLGLGDCVGEFRRRALDSLRRGDLKTAEDCLKTMEDVYSEFMSLESAYNLARDLRRKCDVARRLIEVTRGDITSETRRGLLEKSIKHLEKTIRGKKKIS